METEIILYNPFSDVPWFVWWDCEQAWSILPEDFTPGMVYQDRIALWMKGKK